MLTSDTSTERASPAYIDYKLVVTVRRGAFKVNQTCVSSSTLRSFSYTSFCRLTGFICRLTTSIFYTPLTRAESPSALRQEAYNNGTPLPGPDGDPEGWKVLPPVQIKGTLFTTKPVEIQCTVSGSALSAPANGADITP